MPSFQERTRKNAKGKISQSERRQTVGYWQIPQYPQVGQCFRNEAAFWGKAALAVRCGSYVYKVDELTYSQAH